MLNRKQNLNENIFPQGPETSFGASNFIPSWMFWQKLPRQLQYPKTVILHRKDGTSWGFSIVGKKNTSITFFLILNLAAKSTPDAL